MTNGKMADVKTAKKNIKIVPDSIYTFDKGYYDLNWFRQIDEAGAFFVTRIKNNARFEVTGQHRPALPKKGVISDERIGYTGQASFKKYPGKLRLIEFMDDEEKTYQFLTNNFKLAASSIAEIYRQRWQIELFFKWIKQNLKIKSFLGTSKNAVMTQIWVALILYLLLSYIKFTGKCKYGITELANRLRDTLMSGDQIVQRAIGNTLGKLLNKSLINDTYAGIPGRGIKRAMRRMRRRVYEFPKDVTLYAYKIDIRKFYPSINHDILKDMLRHKIKDKRMLALLFVIVDSYAGGVGLPIGNLMSPIFANFYLSGVDRLAKNLHLIYFRYNDDIAVISTSKQLLRQFKDELHLTVEALCLKVKQNEQIFPLERFGVDIMGYVMKRSTVIVRRRIERRFRRNARHFRLRHEPHRARSLASQWGWLKITKTGAALWKSSVGFDMDTFKKQNKQRKAGATQK